MMIMHGCPSITKGHVLWSDANRDAHLMAAAIGVLAGVFVTFARTPLHLPGHKALFWMVPVLATRLITRARGGATTGALATSLTTLVLGGRLVGGATMMPVIIVAGAILDLAARLVQQRNLRPILAVLMLAIAGSAGNLVCCIARLFGPVSAILVAGNLGDKFSVAFSHVLFGFIAGLLGTVAGLGIQWLRFRSYGQTGSLSQTGAGLSNLPPDAN